METRFALAMRSRSWWSRAGPTFAGVPWSGGLGSWPRKVAALRGAASDPSVSNPVLRQGDYAALLVRTMATASKASSAVGPVADRTSSVPGEAAKDIRPRMLVASSTRPFVRMVT